MFSLSFSGTICISYLFYVFSTELFLDRILKYRVSRLKDLGIESIDTAFC